MPFTPFQHHIEHYQLPERFTFPFYYQPHAIALLAVSDLQQYLCKQMHWQHDFGVNNTKGELRSDAQGIGKMFGVLVVKNEQGQLGYLSAMSGSINDLTMQENTHENKFVPPVFNGLATNSAYQQRQQYINQLTEQISHFKTKASYISAVNTLALKEQQYQQALTAQQAIMATQRKLRKKQRIEQGLLENELLESHSLANQSSTNKPSTNEPLKIQKPLTAAQQQLQISLAKQSIMDKKQLAAIKKQWQQQLAPLKAAVKNQSDHLNALTLQRSTLSAQLQQEIFQQYRFLNQCGEIKTLNELFAQTNFKTPPAGAGECAAPKLLQYAFAHNYQPIALAEFWWGKSPKSEIRQHKNFYPACQGKCKPILSHMLSGMEVDDDPLLVNPAEHKALEIVYQDETLLVVNKPAEFLSVPGKNIQDSVLTRIAEMFPQHNSPFIVHRLDMSTSGLMVIALNKIAHQKLQQQFIQRTVKKHYVALLDGVLAVDEMRKQGNISLPLRGDYYDRPRQLVCTEHGKTAETLWQLIKVNKAKQQTLVKLTPLTGRTHQLRVHCAHQQGLNMSIVGDDLYGKKDQRLCLHAQALEFEHPLTKKLMSFSVKADFCN